jgi:hypothetical protein
MADSLVCVAFGLAAALVEGLPIIGLVFSVSNRIGAAMWAHGESSLFSGVLGHSLGHPTPLFFILE